MAKEVSRRKLLKQTGSLAAAGLTWSASPRRGSALSPLPPKVDNAANRKPASERIRVGCIGVGNRGRNDMIGFIDQPDVDVVALADVYQGSIKEAMAECEKRGVAPKTYSDFRHIIDDPSIDAVMIATPDHWHALPTIFACHAGKDVYVEKPLSHSIGEGRAMVDAARRFNRVTQMGTQIHATDNYRRAVEVVQSGMLGEITKARVWIARRVDPKANGHPKDGTPPPGCDYDLWLGPAPKHAFNELRFLWSFRWFWDYAGGMLSDMGCHIIDLVHWAMELDAPVSVTASGGRYYQDDICETPDTLEAVWEYPPSEKRKRPLQLTWSLTMSNPRGVDTCHGLGIGFYGDNGTLIADYGIHKVYDLENKPVMDRPDPSIPKSPGHVREFVDAVKSRRRCSCDIAYGHQLTKVPLMANIAYRTNRKLQWDDTQERFKNAPEANAHLQREYRKPWTLPT